MGMFKRNLANEDGKDSVLSFREFVNLVGNSEMDEEKALQIPAVNACIEKLTMIISSLEWHLYKIEKEEVVEIKGDKRLRLINDDSGDSTTIEADTRNFIKDYFLYGAYYAYIERYRNTIQSLRYIRNQDLFIQKNYDPIFKDYYVLINGTRYEPHDFLKINRSTKDGVTSCGMLQENALILTTAYNAIKYENLINRTGGNKRGFLTSENKLSPEASKELKKQWKAMYGDNTETCIVLNKGLEFKESSNTSVEMQMNEKKITNAKEITSLFGMPYSVVFGGATEKDYDMLRDDCVVPVIEARARAFNRDLLLEREKDAQWFFACDVRGLMQGNMAKRFEAYKTAIDSGFMQLDEARYYENMPKMGIPFIKLGLKDVFYNVETKEIYTPNTDKKSSFVSGDENSEEDDISEGGEKGDNENETDNTK